MKNVVRLHLTLESLRGARAAAILEVPRARCRDFVDEHEVIYAFRQHRMAGSLRVIEWRREGAE